MMFMILICTFVLASALSQSAPSYVLAKFGESSVLTCLEKCSGVAQWMRSTEHMVAWCNQNECGSVQGFNISHSQYLKGDLSLTISQADYTKRTWYTCQCDGILLHRVYLRLDRVDYSRHVEDGDSFNVDILIPERVKITFNRTGVEGCKTIYERSEKMKVHYDPDYEGRAGFKSCFILRNMRAPDSGVYTVWDTDNDEIIATYTLTVTGNTTRTNQTSPPDGSKHWWVLVGIVLGMLLTVIFIYIVIPRIQTGWTWLRVTCLGEEKPGDPTEKLQSLI